MNISNGLMVLWTYTFYIYFYAMFARKMCAYYLLICVLRGDPGCSLRQNSHVMLGFYTCENLKISKVEIACYYINVGLQICNFQILFCTIT